MFDGGYLYINDTARAYHNIPYRQIDVQEDLDGLLIDRDLPHIWKLNLQTDDPADDPVREDVCFSS